MIYDRITCCGGEQMEKQLLETGEIVSTHGIHGEVKILPWADSPEFLLQFDTYYIDEEPYRVSAARVHKTCVLARIEGVDTPEAAMHLRGKTVSIDRSGVTLPENTVFIADLLGCRVLDEQERELGTICNVLTMPASDVYVIEGEKHYMIPAVKEFVREIDLAQRLVRVHLIEGMASDEN